MVRKALLKNNQASSTDAMRQASSTRARSVRKVCSLKCVRERLTVMRGSRLTADPLWTQAMSQCSLRSWLKTAEVYLEGKLVRMISMRVPIFKDLGLYLVGSLIICVRFRTSSLDFRPAGVLSISQFRLPNSPTAAHRWGAINSNMVSRAQLGAEGGL